MDVQTQLLELNHKRRYEHHISIINPPLGARDDDWSQKRNKPTHLQTP